MFESTADENILCSLVRVFTKRSIKYDPFTANPEYSHCLSIVPATVIHQLWVLMMLLPSFFTARM
jgi:hypothetical protein